MKILQKVLGGGYFFDSHYTMYINKSRNNCSQMLARSCFSSVSFFVWTGGVISGEKTQGATNWTNGEAVRRQFSISCGIDPLFHPAKYTNSVLIEQQWKQKIQQLSYYMYLT